MLGRTWLELNLLAKKYKTKKIIRQKEKEKYLQDELRAYKELVNKMSKTADNTEETNQEEGAKESKRDVLNEDNYDTPQFAKQSHNLDSSFEFCIDKSSNQSSNCFLDHLRTVEFQLYNVCPVIRGQIFYFPPELKQMIKEFLSS